VGDVDLSALCRACRLCCDGSLFGRARLEPDEVATARKNRLRVVANERSFEQACSALSVDGTCAIYEERPRTCRKFVCRLFERARMDGTPIEQAIATALRARELLVHLEVAGTVEPALAKLLAEDFARV
jgi:Fe-S-cluster containining protein